MSQRPEPRPITAATLARCHMRTIVNRRFANGGQQIVQRCIEHPRLTRTRWQGQPHRKMVWCLWVDDRPAISLAAAAAALNRRPEREAA